MVRGLGCVLLIAVMGSVSAVAANPPLRVIYPQPESGDDRYQHGLAVLRLALEKSGVAFTLRPSALRLADNQNRLLAMVENGDGDITVAIAATSTAREQRLRAIHIPIDKGLVGWRLALVPADRPDALADIRSIDDLRHLVAGQGLGWADSAVLKANGLSYITGEHYGNLFKMLAAHRFDYFPRSAREIWAELKAHSDGQVTLDSHLALHYVGATYFFVNKANADLAEALEAGLERAIADGSFDKVFDQEIGRFLADAHFDKRLIIELDNPFMSAETPLNREELWFRPGRK